MNKPIQIYIDTSGKAHVSYECDSCSEWTRTDDACGDEGQYLCPDCYGQQRADQKFIHDWLIFLDEDHPLECGPIAIHKDVVGNRAHRADCSTPDPEDDVTRFGPGAVGLALDHIDNLFFDVTHVYTLMDEGFITRDGANKIFSLQGGAK